MDRSDFLKNLAAAATAGTQAPQLLKNLIELKDDQTVVVANLGGKKRIAVDVRVLHFPGPSKFTPSVADILKLYCETGTLLYYKGPEMPDDYNPITVID